MTKRNNMWCTLKNLSAAAMNVAEKKKINKTELNNRKATNARYSETSPRVHEGSLTVFLVEKKLRQLYSGVSDRSHFKAAVQWQP